MSETSKYRHLTVPFLKGNGVDIGSGGDPVVPNAIQIELPPEEYARYRNGDIHGAPIQWHGDCFNLPFKDNVLDWVYCSHVIEDWNPKRWPSILAEWVRCLKPGGNIVILVPEHKLWQHAVRVLGQTPNCSHWNPEPSLGDVSRAFKEIGLTNINERLTECHPNDYSILATASKPE